MPAPDEKQVVRVECDDDVRADGVASPAGGEERVRADVDQETSRGVKAGRPTGLRRRVRVPAPEEKAGHSGAP